MVNIQWYPGHMEKARRAMNENIKAVDIVIEIRDARIPLASQNPLLEQLLQGRAHLIILSKSDLADPSITEKWLTYFDTPTTKALALDLFHDKSSRSKIIQACKDLTREKREKMIAKGIRNPRAMRAMACGIPNVGKSTMINLITSKNTVKTADKPGVTKSLSWIHADSSLDILDTPGVLWPKFSDQSIGISLAAIGSINEDILNKREIAIETIRMIQRMYPHLLEEQYEAESDADAQEILLAIAQKRNLKKENGEYDMLRSADLFLRELRKAKLGRVSLEMPDEKK